MRLTEQFSSLSGRMRRVFYGWWLVVISGFVMLLAHVPLFHAMGVWAVALEHEFGWSRTQLGLALSFTRIEGGLMGPLEGYLTDRLGTRRLVLFGLLVLGLGFLLFSQVQTLWMFYLAYVVMAVGQGFGGWLPLMTMLTQWFERRLATAIGWANMGSRLGALLLVPAIAWAIDPDYDRLGWQATALCLGFFTLLIALPISWLIRNRPQDYNLMPDGEPLVSPTATAPQGTVTADPQKTTPRPQGEIKRIDTDFTVSQALRTPAFWFISFGHGFSSMAILAIMAHLGLLLADKGFDVQTTAWIVAVYTAVAMVFQPLGGYIGDRIPKRIALFTFGCIQAGAVLMLAFSSAIATFYLFAVLFGIGFGGRNPLTVAIRGDYFGRAAFGKIMGLSSVPMNVLLLIAAPFAGWMRDTQGTYSGAFLVLAGSSFLGGVCFLLARRPVLK